jgi:hypothetical protein
MTGMEQVSRNDEPTGQDAAGLHAQMQQAYLEGGEEAVQALLRTQGLLPAPAAPGRESTKENRYTSPGREVQVLAPGTYDALGENYSYWAHRAPEAMRSWGVPRVVMLGVETQATYGGDAELPEEVGKLLHNAWDMARSYDFGQLDQADKLEAYREQGSYRPPVLYGTELPSQDTIIEWLKMGRGAENPAVGWAPGPVPVVPFRLPNRLDSAPQGHAPGYPDSSTPPSGQLYVTFVDIDLTSEAGAMNVGVIGPAHLMYKPLTTEVEQGKM